MAEFTLLKLQLDDASFTANAPFSGSEGGDEAIESDGGAEVEVGAGGPDAGDGGPRLVPLVVGLVFLVVLAVVARKVRGGSDDSGPAEGE